MTGNLATRSDATFDSPLDQLNRIHDRFVCGKSYAANEGLQVKDGSPKKIAPFVKEKPFNSREL
jgi:hypothetical protein